MQGISFYSPFRLVLFGMFPPPCRSFALGNIQYKWRIETYAAGLSWFGLCCLGRLKRWYFFDNPGIFSFPDGACKGGRMGVAAPAPTLIRAITVPMGTTSFSLNSISSITPRLWKVLHCPPYLRGNIQHGFVHGPYGLQVLCHLKMVASMMLSPSLGITSSTKLIIYQ